MFEHSTPGREYSLRRIINWSTMGVRLDTELPPEKVKRMTGEKEPAH
jgi:hypothetical protein